MFITPTKNIKKNNFPKKVDYDVIKNILPEYIQSKTNFENSTSFTLHLDTNENIVDFFIDIAFFHHEFKNSKLYFTTVEQENIQYQKLLKIWKKLRNTEEYINLKKFIDMYQCTLIIYYIQYFYKKKKIVSIQEFCIFDDFLYDIWKFDTLKIMKYNVFKVHTVLDIFLKYSWCLTEHTSYNLSNIPIQNIDTTELVTYTNNNN